MSAAVWKEPGGSRPEVGDIVFDTSRRRLGRVMAFGRTVVSLRPVGGGREWDSLLERLRPATAAELLSAQARTAGTSARMRDAL